jgi:hypothetical protein
MREKTISDERRSTGTASSSRRSTYFCIAAPARPRYFSIHARARVGEP